jgi:hypothetical protein
MPEIPDLVRERAPQVLGGIRLFYGTTALFAPTTIARRLGVDPDANPAPIHPLRMFGIRTILIGAELLFQGPATRARSMRVAPLIHASDTASAVISGVRRELPPRVAILTTVVSGLNTVLAIVGQPRKRRLAPGTWFGR